MMMMMNTLRYVDDAGLLFGDASKTLGAMKSCSGSTDSPVSHHLSTDSPSSLQPHQPFTSSSYHSSAVTSHYEDLSCLAADRLPSDADAVTWATVTESGAHVTLPQSGINTVWSSIPLRI